MASADVVDALCARQTDARQEASHLRKVQKYLEKERKRTRPRAPEEFMLEIAPDRRDRILIFYETSAYNAEATSEMLARSRLQMHWPLEWGLQDNTCFIEALFLQTPLEHFVDLADGDSPKVRRHRKEAARLFAEWSASAWARDVNRQRKVAPSSYTCARQCEENYEASGAVVPRFMFLHPRVWALRWRRRWCGFLKKTRAREQPTIPVLQTKAPRILRFAWLPPGGGEGSPSSKLEHRKEATFRPLI